MFAVCMQAEVVPASVQDYRDKLLHLRKLRHDLVQRSLPNGPPGTFQQVRPADRLTEKMQTSVGECKTNKRTCVSPAHISLT